MAKLPRLCRFLAMAVAFCLVVLSAARVAFWWYFDNAIDPLPASEWLSAMYLGLRFDARFVLLVLLPMLLLGSRPRLDPFCRRGARVFWTIYLGLAGAATAVVYMADFGHFAYLQTRVDIGAVYLLENVEQSLGMLWETYPVVPMACGWVAGTALWTYLVSLALGYCANRPEPAWGWRRRWAGATVVLGLTALGLYGKLSYYPLRWCDAFVGTRSFTAQVAFNPVLYFIDTVRNGGGAVCDEGLVREHYDEIAGWLGVEHSNKDALDFGRGHRATAAPGAPASAESSRPPNVVIVILESMGGCKTGLAGNPLDATPNLDCLGREGYYFPNFYVPDTGTARSVFCAVTGIPDVEVRGTSTRNPRIVDQHTILTSFAGYEKLYFLGCSTSWANIRGILRNNIPGIRIFEEGDYTSPRVNVWGISDLDLFREADKVLRNQPKPFLAVIQTSCHHRPYTLPDDLDGFPLRHSEIQDWGCYGFESAEEFHSCGFMDYSVGRFMELAAKSGYFDDTIFALFGDHGCGGFAGTHGSKADSQLGLSTNRVPLVLYSPRRIRSPRVFATVAGEPDVLPTLASLAGQNYVNTTIGRDLLDPRFDGARYAFRISRGSPVRVGVIGQEYFFDMDADGGRPRLHRLDGSDGEDVAANLIQRRPEVAASMQRLTRGLYETSKYMLYHNKPRSHESVQGVAGKSPAPARR